VAKCVGCGTELWVGSDDCPTCDPAPLANGRSGRPGADVATSAARPAPPEPTTPADPRRRLALGLLVGFLPLGLVALRCSDQVARANERGDLVTAHQRARRLVQVAVAVPVLWLIGWGVVPALTGLARSQDAQRQATTAVAVTGEPSFPLLSGRLQERGVPRTEADCLAAAVLTELEPEDWPVLAADPSPELQGRLSRLTSQC
jgi:hypothetical protein